MDLETKRVTRGKIHKDYMIQRKRKEKKDMIKREIGRLIGREKEDIGRVRIIGLKIMIFYADATKSDEKEAVRIPFDSSGL